MGNESSKPKTDFFTLKSGPSSRIVQQHLENAKKSRILQLKSSGLKTFPPIIENVADIIRNLDFSFNKISEIPPFISRFKALKQLHLTNNLLSTLPDEIGCIKTLELLNLSNNKLTGLPNTLVGCSSLRNLIVSNNKISIFPIVSTQLQEIEIVDLSSNQIGIIPEEIKNLKAAELNLNSNCLNTIHTNLSKCKRLKVFRVNENCLQKDQFSREILEDSNISLITFAGNLFQDKDFQNLSGYEAYQERFLATRRKAD